MPSDLPILPSDPAGPPRRSIAERYGAVFYLGIGGLAVLGGLLLWFGMNVWLLRGVFEQIYILHDPGRPEAERINAAYVLSRDSRVTQRQYWDIALRKDLPPLARYLMAEALTTEAVADDPRGYALAAARSHNWPDWFRLLVARPMAYAADDEIGLPAGFVAELCHDTADPFLKLWTAYTLAALGDVGIEAAPDARASLDAAAEAPGPTRTLSRTLLSALAEPDAARRNTLLDRATVELRTTHPEAATIWKGWTIKGGQISQDHGSASVHP